MRHRLMAAFMAATVLAATVPALAQERGGRGGWGGRGGGGEAGAPANPGGNGGGWRGRGGDGGNAGGGWRGRSTDNGSGAAAPNREWRGRGDQPGGWTRREAAPAAAPSAAPAPAPQATPRPQGRDNDGARGWRGRQGDGAGAPGSWRGRAETDPNWRSRADGNRDWNRDRNDAARNWARDRNDRNWNDRDRNGWNNGRWNGNRAYGNQGRLDDRSRWSGVRRWDNDWRRDNRYDWQRYRAVNRNFYRMQPYYAPYGWSYGYRRFSIGLFMDSLLFANDYWIDDPYSYRLPPAYGSMRWVRYYDDALLVDTRDGYVVDVIHDFFW